MNGKTCSPWRGFTGERIMAAPAIEAQGLARTTGRIANGKAVLRFTLGERKAVGISGGAVTIAIQQFTA